MRFTNGLVAAIWLAVAMVATAATPAIARDGAVILTPDDFTGRPYHVLGDLKVTVRKQTLFSKEPTRERVDEKLRKAAKKLDADAVILIRYGTVGMGVIGWGELEGRGRAIRFD